MDDKSSSINFVLPELIEFKNLSNPDHYWAIAVSDSKFVIFYTGWGTGDMTGLGGLAEWNESRLRKNKVNSLMGTDIEKLIVKEEVKYVFNREIGAQFRIKVSKNWLGARLLLLEDDTKMVEKALGYSPKIRCRQKQLDEIKQAVPELEFEYVKE